MSAQWPLPGDSPVVVTRKVALAYRACLAAVDEACCAALDERMRGWGQGWVVAHLLTFDMDDWLTPRQAAELASVQVRQIARHRRNGRLTGRLGPDGWEFQAREVIALSTNKRGREKGAAV